MNWRCRIGLHEWTPWGKPFRKRINSPLYRRRHCPHCLKIQEEQTT